MLNGIRDRIKALLPGGASRSSDIDLLIERVGAKHTPEDRRRAYALFLSSALHAPVVATHAAVSKKKTKKKSKKKAAASKKKSKKKAAKKGAAEQQSLQLAMAEVNDYQMLLVYTGEDDPRIGSHGEHCLSLPGRQAFEMALQTPGVDGLLIHNRRNAWMALPKVLIEEILEVFPPDDAPPAG